MPTLVILVWRDSKRIREKEEKEAQKRIKEENLKQEALKRKMVCELIRCIKHWFIFQFKIQRSMYFPSLYPILKEKHWKYVFSHGTAVQIFQLWCTEDQLDTHLCIPHGMAKLVWCTTVLTCSSYPNFPDLAMTVSKAIYTIKST